jgi:hypothetical protein
MTTLMYWLGLLIVTKMCFLDPVLLLESSVGARETVGDGLCVAFFFLSVGMDAIRLI